MDFPVPQFIDVEEKILGPLTFKQTLYVVGAAGLLFILYFFVEMWLFVILAIIIFGAALALAFIKIGGKTFSQFLISVIIYSFTPHIFIWKKNEVKEKSYKIELSSPSIIKNKEADIVPEAKQQKGLKGISKKIDLGIKPVKNFEE